MIHLLFMGRKSFINSMYSLDLSVAFFAGGTNIGLNEFQSISEANEYVLFHQFTKRYCS